MKTVYLAIIALAFCGASCVSNHSESANLLANGSFEQAVMPPQWHFVTADQYDQDGLIMCASTGHAHRVEDKTVAADGTCYLAFRGRGPCALDSAPIAYHGELISVSGQCAGVDQRTLIGKPAGLIELLGFDNTGKIIEYHAVWGQPDGDTAWQSFTYQYTMPGGVTQIALRLRTAMSAFGEFRVDNLKLTLTK
jgi:hypothetical protein